MDKGPRRTALLALLLLRAAAFAGQSAVEIAVVDEARLPVAAVLVELREGESVAASARTDERGRASFAKLKPAVYGIAATKEGLAPLRRNLDLSQGTPVSIELTMIPVILRRESVEVKGTASAVERGASSPVELAARTTKELPSRPSTVADVLPLIPGVVREPGGGLTISAGSEHRSALIVNSADVTDPATGQFGLTVPIDSVEIVNVYQTAYLAEYGRFTAGLVSVETRRGGDKWKWELNDPLPEFRIRSYHLRGVKTATPRVNFEGPLIARKLYLSEGFEYETRKTAVYTLPFPYNQKRQAGVNSFTQLDWIASDKHLVTATVHLAPQRQAFVNINYFNPQSTAPDTSTHNYTATVADRLTLFGGLLENTLSITRFDAAVWGQGSEDLILTPMGNRGNYFAQQNRNASRISGRPTYSLPPLDGLGKHNLKAGAYIAGSADDGEVREHPVDILDAAQRRIKRITFPRARSFDISDTELAFFAQDHWVLTPRLAFNLGVRTESQQISGAFRVAPRAGISWSPLSNAGTVIRLGYGLFYDHVPLNVFSFNRYPDQVITTYGPDGEITSGPSLYLNTLGQVKIRFPFVFQKPIDGNFSPRSANWSLQVEHPVTRMLRLRATYIQNFSDGLVILHPLAPDPQTDTGAYLLTGTGQSRYRQFEVTARLQLPAERQLFFSYTHGRARGDLNDFGNYLGTLPVPIIRENQFGNLPADLPNRFLAWGLVPLPWKFRIAPVVEYRSGFPYLETNAAQEYAGVPNQQRFPNLLSVDARVSKDFQVNPKYAVRLSVSGFNLTNHFRPESVHSNTADPAYGLFFGHRGRRFTADFDVLF